MKREEGQIILRDIEEEIKDSYLNYAMSVIVGRALPDVRDGLKPVHRRVLFSMKELNLEHTKPFKKAARIVGECFVEDTLVLTNKGLLPIQDIAEGNFVFTQEGLNKVTQLYEMPERELLKIKLENGTYNIVTPSQRFKVLDKNLEFTWKEARGLTNEDYIVIKASYPEIQELVELDFPYLGKRYFLNKNIAYLLGFFISDGWITNDYGSLKRSRIGFSSIDRAIMEKIADILLQEFNYVATIEAKEYGVRGKNRIIQNTKYTIRINRLDINRFLAKNFNLAIKNAFTKEIPPQIFVSPKEVIFSFVSGLLEGDGSVHSKRKVIHYGSVSRKLINQLAILLQHQGIFSSRYIDADLRRGGFIDKHYIKANYKFHYLEFRSSNALLLAKNIHLFNESKQNRVQRLLAMRKFPSNYDLIPYGARYIFKELSKQHLGSGWYKDINEKKFRMGIKYPAGCKIRYSKNLLDTPLRRSQIIDWGIRDKLKRINFPISNFVEGVIKDDIYFLKVASIEKASPQKTYDLQIEAEHEFIANGMLVHNCLGKFHPHGDVAVYDTLVRMAQDFSLRYPLVDGQGNFGCFTKDTKIWLCDGRRLSFGELMKEQKAGKRHWTFAYNHKKKKIEVSEVKSPRLTRKNEKILKVTLDNGEKIKCTYDHPFMLRDGSYKKAKDLKLQDSLMPLYVKHYDGEGDFNLKGYEVIYQPHQDKWEFIHRLADEWNLRSKIYKKSAGKIRHHIDFNKLNNNPNNVQRIQWGQHWRLHKEITAWRHKNDSEYIEKLAKGRKKFLTDPKNLEKIALRLRTRNLKNWRNPAYQKKMRGLIRQAWQRPEYRQRMIESSSKNLKKLWKKKEFQELLSKLKSEELKKRWQEQNYRDFIAEITRKTSLRIWSDPKHREYISKLNKERWNNPRYRQKMIEQSKRLWKDPEFRSNYSVDHFRKMAKTLWKNPLTRKLHREKARKQWEDGSFREKIIESIKTRNKRRLAANPDLMRDMAQRAAVSLRKKWQDPLYKRKVAKSRILGFVNDLMNRDQAATPELYEQIRQRGMPRLKTALKHFSDFEDMLIQAKQKLNHKVKKIEFLNRREDVYDLTIDRWHNFALGAGVFVHNSIDGDPAAAQRYTEARLAAISDEMLVDIEKNTVDFMPNFDSSLEEPAVLPARLPNLLVNGTSGIAVGMATNMPPHNLSEIITGIEHLIDHPETEIKELFRYIKGPDFPTGGLICGRAGIVEAYTTGRGKLTVRARASIEHQRQGKDAIIITEIPYQVNKANLIESTAGLVEQKKIEGISDIRDESDREGIRVVIELKRDCEPQIVLNQLFKHTQLEITFGIINLALVNGRPHILNLKQLLSAYISHRKDVIRRRTIFELEKAQRRAHILEGLKIALKHIDRIIKTIKTSKNTDEARKRLMKEFGLTEIQAQAILEMQLQRLTALEQGKINAEYLDLIKRIELYRSILASEKKIEVIIKEETNELKRKYADERRTEIVAKVEEIELEDLIAEEDMVITISHQGYLKRLSTSNYRKQRRGGRGVSAMETREKDFVEHVFVASSKDYLLVFTNKGKLYWLKVYEIPEAGRAAKGKAIVNLLPFASDEAVSSVVSVKEFSPDKFLVMATRQGLIKKTQLSLFANPRKTGIIAASLKKGDQLIGAELTDAKSEILLATREGKAIRFSEKQIRQMGRQAGGVRGIRLAKKDEVIDMEILPAQVEKMNLSLLTVTANGFAKQTDFSQYSSQSRGGKGMINIKITEKNGKAVGIKKVAVDDEIMVITQKAMLVRCLVKDIRKTGRSTQGVHLINLEKGDRVSSLAKIAAED